MRYERQITMLLLLQPGGVLENFSMLVLYMVLALRARRKDHGVWPPEEGLTIAESENEE